MTTNDTVEYERHTNASEVQNESWYENTSDVVLNASEPPSSAFQYSELEYIIAAGIILLLFIILAYVIYRLFTVKWIKYEPKTPWDKPGDDPFKRNK